MCLENTQEHEARGEVTFFKVVKVDASKLYHLFRSQCGTEAMLSSLVNTMVCDITDPAIGPGYSCFLTFETARIYKSILERKFYLPGIKFAIIPIKIADGEKYKVGRISYDCVGCGLLAASVSKADYA